MIKVFKMSLEELAKVEVVLPKIVQIKIVRIGFIGQVWPNKFKMHY